MEYIKKTILLKMTTGTTQTISGNTTYVIVPDLSLTYGLKFNLISENNDIGFLNSYDEISLPIGNIIITEVTGETISRLNELRKYKITDDFSLQYIAHTTGLTDGVDYSASYSNTTITYYIDEIKYVDDVSTSAVTTTFRFNTIGSESASFINSPVYKIPENENIVSLSKVNDDVFILRQEISVFDKNYRMEYITNLLELETYAGGNFFNIINNT
jgi:hypothetical protein